MNLGEAVQLINDITKRPDKSAEVRAAINRSIGLFATKKWAHDLVELTHAISASDYAQSFPINAAPFIRFRSIKYIRPTGYRTYLTYRDSSRIFQENGHECMDSWYRSGTSIVFKLSKLQPSLEIGYYQFHVPLTANNHTDWMLDEIWPALHDAVCAEIFGQIGNDQERARYQNKGMALLESYYADIGEGVTLS